MIIRYEQGKDILNSGETRIAFAINTEGLNDAGFAGVIARKFWPELANTGPQQLGTVLTKACYGVTFYGLVCHSLEHGWKDQEKVIKECFDKIKLDEHVASISIGTGLIGILSGADFKQIKAGMENSYAQIVLY